MQISVPRNPVFAPVWECQKRYICMKGSAGSGKSVDTAQHYIVRLLSEPGRNLLCVRKIADSNRNSTYAELCKAIGRMKLWRHFKATVSPMRIVCDNGNEVLFGGVNDEQQREKLKSVTATNGQLTDIWVEEATEISQEDLELLDDRLRGVLPPGLFYQIRMTFNPVSSSHWIKRVFFDCEDEQVFTHHSTYRDNKFCDKQYYARMERRRRIDPDGYRIYGLGEWGETSGLIFTNFVVERFEEQFDSVVYGQDFGFNHPNALLKVGMRDGDVYICKELYLRERDTADIIALAADWDRSVPMICDCAEPDRILTWRRAGFRASGVAKFAGSVSYGIDWLKRRQIHICPDCVNTIREIQQWRWQKDSDGNYIDSPVPFGDDAMAALRYACSFWIPKREQAGRRTERFYNFACERPNRQRFL